MTEQAMRACKPDEPVMVAWKAHQETEDFKNSFNWATRIVSCDQGPNGDARRATDGERSNWVKGALWACFMAGFKTAIERAAMLHEDINPASDEERLHKVPGAGGMGAVIQYRDKIRQLIR